MPSDQPLRLRVHAHPLTETPPPPVLLVGGAISVGRRDDNGWILPDQSASVSRRHATVEERNGRWCVIDDSANGTFLNGQMIGKGGVRPLTPGDVIKIGDYEVVVETSTDSGAPPMRSGMPGLPPSADPFGIGDLSRPEYGAPPPPPPGPSPFDPPPPERPLEAPRAADIFGDFGARGVAPGVGIGANADAPLAALGGGIDSSIDGLGGGSPAFGGGGDPFGAQRSPAGGGWGAPSPGFGGGGGGLINDPLSTPGGGSAFGDPFGSANAIRDPLASAQAQRSDALGSADPFSTPGGASVFGTDRGGSADSFGATPPPAPLGYDAVPIPPVSGPGSSALPSDWNASPGTGLAPPPADLDPIEQALSGLASGGGAASAGRPAPGGGAMPFGAAAALGSGALAGAAARPAPAPSPPSRPAPAAPPPVSGGGGGAQWLQSPPPGAAAGGLFGDASAGAEDPFSHPAAPAPAPRAPRPATPAGTAMPPQGPPPQAFQHGAAPPPPPAPARPMPSPAAPAPPAAAVAGGAGGDALLQAFIEGAGLREIPAGLDAVKAMRTLGSSTRAIVSTLARLLEARRLLKGEFRITQTVVGARENNPLKFSVDDSELMLVLLGAVRPGFQSGEAAVWDAGRDLEAHQVAMLSAFRATLDAVFQRLSPEAVAAGEEAGFFGRVLPQARDAALWERYAKMHAEMRQDLGNTLAGRMGQIFAEAYEAENGRRGGSR